MKRPTGQTDVIFFEKDQISKHSEKRQEHQRIIVHYDLNTTTPKIMINTTSNQISKFNSLKKKIGNKRTALTFERSRFGLFSSRHYPFEYHQNTRCGARVHDRLIRSFMYR